MTKWDKLLIVVIVLCSVIGMMWTTKITSNSDHLYLIIEIDGEEYKKLSIDDGTKTKLIPVDTKYGHNLVKVEGEKVSMYESTCKNHLCIQMGTISKANQVIVCIPNRVSVKLVSNKSNIDVLSY
ncbi:NusG domain II-containing protein [Lutibacter sp. B2]|nr:NusG domain II-containing protein [Lutibacter sp. B2]